MQLKLKGIMKKLLSKVRQKKQPQEPAGRITTDTLAEHREKVLAGGRKFKYPVQYQRHRLVVNTIIIVSVTLVALLGVGWYLLYSAQNTSEFMYRVTKVVPVPVAVVDGQQVRYSDYLVKYRSAAHYLIEKEQIDPRSDDGKSQLDYVKNQAMQDAISDAYATKLARELDVKVTDADLEEFLKQQRQSSDGEVSESTYNAVISDYYGWSPEEYRDAMKNKLLRQKVAYAADAEAETVSKRVASKITEGATDFAAIAKEVNGGNEERVVYMAPAWVPKNNQDGGLAAAAGKLKDGQVSTAIKTTTGDGYYYVKLLETNETQLRYEYIHIPLKEFVNELEQLEKDNKLTKYITLADPSQQQ